MRRFLLFWVAPVALVLALGIAPLATGARTLYLRDVLNTHLGMRAHLAESIRGGELPLIDPLRAGGQALVGNPNSLALYPDNLLLLFSSTLWQLNAHFWLHWIVALGAMFWLGRRWGLGREGALAAAAVYAFCGYFVSQMNLYNGVAGAALAPGLAAALLASGTTTRRARSLAALGALWALALLAGDPIVAVVGLGTALALALPVRRSLPWPRVILALAFGSLVALPQYVELLRLLPGSSRGSLGYDALAQVRGMPDARALLEMLVPFFFGRPDRLEFWGAAYFGGTLPLYFSLAPGLLALAAVVVGGSSPGPRRRVALTLLLATTAVCFAGGLFGGLVGLLPGGGLFRYGAKLALGAAIAGSLLAGRGFERLLDEAAARRLWSRALVVIGGVELILFVLFAFGAGPLEDGFRQLMTRGLAAPELARLRVGWAALCLIQIAIVVVGVALGRGLAARTRLGVAALVAVHVVSQSALTRPMVPTDSAAIYRRPAGLLEQLPADAVLVHGGFLPIFGDDYAGTGSYPARRAHEFARRGQAELFSYPVLLAGRRMELNYSPDGLDSSLVHLLGQTLGSLGDRDRLALLRATGVDRLLVARHLRDDLAGDVRLVATGSGRPPIRLYALAGAPGDAVLAGEAEFAPHVRAGFEALLAPGFDPRRRAVIAGEEPPRSGPPGAARIERFAAERIELEADSEAGGFVVVRRAWLPIWRVEVDGAAARPRIANLTRLAVEVPPGRHRVEFFVSRAPFRLALAGSLLGVAGLLWTVRRRPLAA